MFGGMGPEKILLLVIVVLLLFGAKRIPEIGSSFGKGIREFKKSIGGDGDDVARADLRAPGDDLPVISQGVAISSTFVG